MQLKFHSHRDAQSNQQTFVQTGRYARERSKHIFTGTVTDDEERPGGRQNSLSRVQLIIKVAVGTVKLSRSAIRELRELYTTDTDFKVRASVLDTSIRP